MNNDKILYLKWPFFVFIVCIIILPILLIVTYNYSDKYLNNNKYPKTYTYRNITEEEINSLIPSNYEIIKDKNGVNNGIIIVNNFINNTNYDSKSVVLLLRHLEPYYGHESIVLSLGFDIYSNKWVVHDKYTNKKFNDISNKYSLTDLDNNGVVELHLEFSFDGGNDVHSSPVVLSYNKNLFLEEIFGSFIYNDEHCVKMSYRFLENKKEYVLIEYIWEPGESHYGCHYFKLAIYKYDSNLNKFSWDNDYKTKVKFALDAGDSHGLCEVVNVENLLNELNKL